MSVMPFVKPGVTNSVENPFLHHLFYCYSKKIKNTDFSQNVQAKVKQNVNLVICQVVFKSVILRDDYLTGGLELEKE